VLRFAIGNFQTGEADIRETWQLISNTAATLSTAAAEPALSSTRAE
jgi:hypothetical protein